MLKFPPKACDVLQEVSVRECERESMCDIPREWFWLVVRFAQKSFSRFYDEGVLQGA